MLKNFKDDDKKKGVGGVGEQAVAGGDGALHGTPRAVGCYITGTDRLSHIPSRRR